VAVRDYSLTLSGAAQRLSAALADPTPGGPDDAAFRQLIFSAAPGNSAVVYVGATALISSTVHGFSLDPTQASQQPVSVGPFETGPMKLSEFYVLGTSNDVLHVLGIPF
jgi:hypothetical protein